ncbi:unnamed protein product [Discula destructiva]
MSPSLAANGLGAVLIGVAAVSAHGSVHGINVAGVWYEGYDPTSFPYKADPPQVVGWTASDFNTGFVAPADYTSGDIICHVDATPAGGYASVQAGDEIQAYWTSWPASHHGPIVDYLANCNGDCTVANKMDLHFFKIAGVGLMQDTTAPGKWATDTLIANNHSWVIKMPDDLVEGNYVWRHEIIALHSAEDSDGAQNYPQCFNLAVTGTGTLAPTGTLGTALYSESEGGIKVDIYRTLDSYDIPGPTQIASGTNLVQFKLPITGSSAAFAIAVSQRSVSAPAAVTTAASIKLTAASLSSIVVATSSMTRPISDGVVKNSSAASSVLAAASTTGKHRTAESCKKRPHARGLNA